MTIGLVSDTHGYFDPQIHQHFNDCDEVWHLGDVGSQEVLREVQSYPEHLVVYGNIDGSDIIHQTQENHIINREGLNFLLTHISGKPLYYTKRVQQLFQENPIDVIICGHSHIVKVQKKKSEPKHVYINPGAAGKQGFHRVRTIMKMEVENKKIVNLNLIELGKR